MKNILLFLSLIFAACNSEPEPKRAVFASIETPQPEPQRAYNVGQTTQGVSAYYADSDSQFTLYFNQCAVIETDGETLHRDAEVYQESPGVFIADFGGGEFVRLNTKTGNTTAYLGGASRVYRKQPTP